VVWAHRNGTSVGLCQAVRVDSSTACWPGSSTAACFPARFNRDDRRNGRVGYTEKDIEHKQARPGTPLRARVPTRQGRFRFRFGVPVSSFGGEKHPVRMSQTRRPAGNGPLPPESGLNSRFGDDAALPGFGFRIGLPAQVMARLRLRRIQPKNRPKMSSPRSSGAVDKTGLGFRLPVVGGVGGQQRFDVPSWCRS